MRVLLTLALPFILIWAFVAEFCCEMRRAFGYACLEVRANIEAYHRHMRGEW
jgi:hypothetical protein